MSRITPKRQSPSVSSIFVGAALLLLIGYGQARAAVLPSPNLLPDQEVQSEIVITNKWCPVLTDELVEAEFSTEYRGELVFLCCRKCLKQFEADPEAYADNLPVLASQVEAQEPAEDSALPANNESVEHGDHSHDEALDQSVPSAEAEESDHGEHSHGESVEASLESEPEHDDGDAEQHDHSDHGDSDSSESPSLIQWLGRFHPMLVHFPISLLLMAAGAELLLLVTGKKSLAFAARFCLWGGALGALIAAPLGWANATAVADSYRGFSADLLFYHRWVGVATASVACLALIAGEAAARGGGDSIKRAYRGFLVVSVLLVSVAGHLGASLIYGWDYLDW